MIAPLIVALLLTVILWAIAAAHAFWGLGGVWPATDARALARAVVGRPGIKAMPGPIACLFVTIMLLAAGFWPLIMLGAMSIPLVSQSLVVLAGWVLAFVFTARGVASFLPAFRRHFPEQPFARYDRAFYGPLCLLIAAGLLFLLTQGILT